MFWTLVVVCEALFWLLLCGFALSRYLWGRRQLSLLFLAAMAVNEYWLVPFALRDAWLNGRFSVFHADVLLEAAALPVVLAVWGKDLFRRLDRGAQAYVARVRAITEAEGAALPKALVAAARPSPELEASGQDEDRRADDLDHARRQRRGWYVHLAVFLVGQGLIQLALSAGLLEPTSGPYFGDGPRAPVQVGPLSLTFDVAGLRRVWLVVLAVDFLWSFSYTLWPRKRYPADRRA